VKGRKKEREEGCVDGRRSGGEGWEKGKSKVDPIRGTHRVKIDRKKKKGKMKMTRTDKARQLYPTKRGKEGHQKRTQSLMKKKTTGYKKPKESGEFNPLPQARKKEWGASKYSSPPRTGGV